MARFCFYCNRELESGESCHCRAEARERLRRQREAAQQRSQETAYRQATQQERRYTPPSQPARPSRHNSRIDFSNVKPSLVDFLRPLDRLDSDTASLPASMVWLGIASLLAGGFFFSLTRRSIAFAVGVTTLLLSLAIFTLLLMIQFRFRLRRRLSFSDIFARARLVFLYASLFLFLATFTVMGNPLYGMLLFASGLFVMKSGLLWQLRRNSPLERNQYLLISVLTLILHGLFLSFFFQWLMPIGSVATARF